MQVDALLLERAHEALGDPVALRFPDVRRRDRAPEPLHLVDPRVGDVLRAPVAPERQAPRHVLAEPPEGVADALANGLERRPAIAELGRVPADDFVEMVIDRAEEPAPPVLLGIEARRIGAPHHVRPIGGDRAVVRRVAIRRARGGAGPAGRARASAAARACRSRRSRGGRAARAPCDSPRHETGTPPGRRGSPSTSSASLMRGLGPALARRLPRRPPRPPRTPTTAPADTIAQIMVKRIAAAPCPDCAAASSPAPLPLVREAPFFDEVLGQLQPHHQLADLRAGQGQLRSSGSALVRSPRLPCSRKIRCQLLELVRRHLALPRHGIQGSPRAAAGAPTPSSAARSSAPATPPRPRLASGHCPQTSPSWALGFHPDLLGCCSSHH